MDVLDAGNQHPAAEVTLVKKQRRDRQPTAETSAEAIQ